MLHQIGKKCLDDVLVQMEVRQVDGVGLTLRYHVRSVVGCASARNGKRTGREQRGEETERGVRHVLSVARKYKRDTPTDPSNSSGSWPAATSSLTRWDVRFYTSHAPPCDEPSVKPSSDGALCEVWLSGGAGAEARTRERKRSRKGGDGGSSGSEGDSIGSGVAGAWVAARRARRGGA